MCSSPYKNKKNRRAQKRKSDTSLDRPSITSGFEESSASIWSTYLDIYDIIAVKSSEVQTTEECIANTRVIDVATSKLIDDVQRLDLNSLDLWTDIAERLVNGWNNFFSGSENLEGWSIGDIVPLNRYKSNLFSSKSVLLKRNNPDGRCVETQKKVRSKRKDDNSQTKLAKPIQGSAEDKPPLLIEHMEKIKTVLSKLCTKSDPAISYLKLVLHPTSFSFTVYNIFAVAFLIREGIVMLTIGRDDEPMVKPLSNFKFVNSSNDNRKKSSFLVSLTTEEWQMLVKKLNITCPLIPNPDGFEEEDEFYEKFTMSQNGKKSRKK